MVFSNLIVTTNALRLRKAGLGDWGFQETEEEDSDESEETVPVASRSFTEKKREVSQLSA